MNQMTEPSMYKPSELPDWPVNAIPRRWIEALFAKMSAFYGARFADLWRGTNILEVQKAWAIELGKLSSAQMKAGSDSLTAFPKPPTLPEFIAHCRQARAEAVASTVAKLEDLPKISAEEAESNLKRLREPLATLARPKEPTAEWAFKLVMQGKSASGKPLPFSVANCATDAITSEAGRLVVDKCADPELKKQYGEVRQTIVDNYRMRGIRLWNVK